MKKKSAKKKMLLAASVAGLLAVTGALTGINTVYADIECQGANACKGQGACGGKGNSCAGKNACKGLGWVKASDAAACEKLGGTPGQAIPAPAAA